MSDYEITKTPLKITWNESEKFFKLIANNDSIHYSTQIALTDYILAFKNLKYSVDKKIFYNPSSITLFFKTLKHFFSILFVANSVNICEIFMFVF